MIAIVLIALAAGCASALMFASIVSGALISLAAVLSGAAAADGGGARMGSARRDDRRHRGGLAASARSSACPTASPLPSPSRCPAWWLGHLALLGRPVADAGLGQWRRAGRARPRMVSGRPHPALDRGLCRADHDCRAAHARHRRRNHHRLAAARLAAYPRPARREPSRAISSDGSMRWSIIAPAAATIVAMMTLTLNLWLAAKITATSGRLHRPWPDLKSADAAADDAGGALRRAGLLLHRRDCRACSRRS